LTARKKGKTDEREGGIVAGGTQRTNAVWETERGRGAEGVITLRKDPRGEEAALSRALRERSTIQNWRGGALLKSPTLKRVTKAVGKESSATAHLKLLMYALQERCAPGVGAKGNPP